MGRSALTWHALERAVTKLRADGAALHWPTRPGRPASCFTGISARCASTAWWWRPRRCPCPGPPAEDRPARRRAARPAAASGGTDPDPRAREVDESIRDLTRARADAVDDLLRAKQRLKSFLLRAGLPLPRQGRLGRRAPALPSRAQAPLPALQGGAGGVPLRLRSGFDASPGLTICWSPRFRSGAMYPAVKALMAMRGFQLVAATVLVAEIGDIRRFAHPRHLMAFLGLVPRETAPADTRRIGAITKAGNGHARWMLVETVQSALLPPKVSRAGARQEGQPARRGALVLEGPVAGCTNAAGTYSTAA